ncbi:MAG: exonuclease domain-containing protein [Clostridiales bacterium]|nr:exonuclease domain-containing protein [Clostridiales bacterium]
MSYVFFDLEWNQGYPRSEADRLDEIIQIGAYRLDSWQDEGAAFSAYVRPTIHKKLHHHVKKLLPLELSDLKKADSFQTVIQDFFRWCGPDPQFFTWGNSDARVLDMNLCWYRMEEYLDLEIYDLQHAYDLLVLGSSQQASLKDAVERLELVNDGREYHDAGNDAYFTARIGQALVARYGSLPDPETLHRMDGALRERVKREARQDAVNGLNRILEEGEPAFTRICAPSRTEEEQLKSRATRVFRCPKCDNVLCNGNWYQVNNHYLARSRCLEHGRYYTCLTLKKIEHIGCTAELRVYDADHFDPDLFHQCKVGGEAIMVAKVPKKRKRSRSRKPKNTPKLKAE